MLFNSFEFLVFFPLVLALYYVLGRRGQNLLLLLASYLFYGWWDWRFCSLLALSTLIDFFCGLAMGRWPGRKRVWLAVSVGAGLGILGFFKYFNFFVDTAALALSSLGVEPHLPVLRIVLPVGISFYTFQTMSYTLDVYRGHLAPTRNLLDFGLYVAFFPQLVAGPIERATHLLKQFAAPRVVTRSMIESGCFLILLGYFRKVVIADGVSPMVETIFASSATAPWHQLVTGAVLFSIQIYGDFAGYSDIARGLSRLLGIQLMVNFKQPYLSRNITEFWRRWHISLSTWLRDYLYIPLGGNRGGTAGTYRNLMLTMLIGGLWHGANWTFVVWGGLHGVYLAVHKMWLARRRIRPEFGPVGRMTPGAAAGMAATFLLVGFAWIFFRCSSLAEAFRFMAGIFSFRGGLEAVSVVGLLKLFFYSLLVFVTDWPAYVRDSQEGMLDWPWMVRGGVYAAMVFLLLLLRPLNETPFIYFQF